MCNGEAYFKANDVQGTEKKVMIVLGDICDDIETRGSSPSIPITTSEIAREVGA